MPITRIARNHSATNSRRTFQAVIRILDDETGAEARDFAGEAGETDGIQTSFESLGGCGPFVIRKLASVLSEKAQEGIDLFDRVQLAFVIRICRESATLSDAGRKLFAATREHRKTANDADRLRKYLARFDLDWQSVR